MKKSDDELGMQRPITRRDIVHGLGAIAVGALLPPSGWTGVAIDRSTAASYPPLRDGLRGNHAGSFEAMHHLARHARQDWQAPESSVSEIFDLVVVGAGISGLCAAYFYKREHPDARILILDNHDDFGGHAKRNEFDVDGRHSNDAKTIVLQSSRKRLFRRSRYKCKGI